MATSVTKTYKMSETAAAALESMMEKMREADPSANWQSAFDALTMDLSLTSTATGASRIAEARDFRHLVDRLVGSYTSALAAIVNAEERADAEIKRLTSKAIDRAERAEQRAEAAEKELDELRAKLADADAQIAKLTKELENATAAASLTDSAEKIKAMLADLKKADN